MPLPKAISASYLLKSYFKPYSLKAYLPLEYMGPCLIMEEDFIVAEFYIHEARNMLGSQEYILPCINKAFMLIAFMVTSIYSDLVPKNWKDEW